MADFHDGETINLESGSSITIQGNCFKRGGQGSIYHATLCGNPVILKWYHSQSVKNNDKFRSNLKKLTEMERIEGFVMPDQITVKDHGSFGFIMEPIPVGQDVVQLSSVIFDEGVEFKAVKARIESPRLIAEHFANLHSRNLVFKDINDANIFVNLRSPNVYICDCDNIAEPGSQSSVKGKLGFLAPELIEPGAVPDEFSDRFSLAIVLYMLIMRDKPFEGEAIHGIDRDAMDSAIRENPVFTMDPNDSSNRPNDQHVVEIWDLLPDYIKQLFVKTFTIGIRNKQERTSAEEWSVVLNRWISEYVPPRDGSSHIQIKCKKRFQPIFFVVDSSCSMTQHRRMEQVNEALNKYIRDAEQFVDTEIAINILQFSDDAHWLFDSLIPIKNITGNIDLKVETHYTHLSEALWKLNEELSKSNVLQDSKHPNKPLVLLFSDGDVKQEEYRVPLDSLRRNEWFEKAEKYAIGIETTESGQTMLRDFAENPDNVRNYPQDSEGEDLSKFIQNVTMAVTQTSTQTYGSLNDKLGPKTNWVESR